MKMIVGYFVVEVSLFQYERESRRSPKIEKLGASGKVTAAKVTTLTFMLF